jgi:hypothetical protein
LSERDAIRADEDLRALLAEDAGLLDTAAEVSAVLREAEIDPAFLSRLRGDVVRERQRVIDTRQARRWRWLPDLRLPRPAIAMAAVAAGAVAAALLVTLLVPRLTQPRPALVTASSPLTGLASVDPAGPVVVHFSRPMDHAAVARALHVAPATAVRATWSGNDLVVTPLHGLVANAPYVLTIDRALARTATGASLAADLHVVFGTAGLALPGGAKPAPTGLPLRFVAAAGEGSEAVITGSGQVVATSASSFGFTGLLRLHADGTLERLDPATDAICVSRSGRSLAYLTSGSGGTAIVMAAGDASGGRVVRAPVDAGSPLGWINDDEVSFVGGGQLQAVDRAGHTRVLSADRVDAAKDTVVIAPGGRYVFLRPAGAPSTPGQGQLVDLTGRTRHPLAGIVGQPAFSADGASAVWVDGSGSSARLARAPSAGGPVLTVPLAVAAGDQVSDLAVSPDGSRLVYSVTHAGGDGEMRLAALDDGATLAVSRAGAGESPNWAPSGGQVAVLTHSGGQPQIEVAQVPAQTADAGDAVQAVAGAFADAQLSGDRDALRALAASGAGVDALPRASRASLVQVLPGAGGASRVELRLVIDPTPDHPVPRAIEEMLNVRPDPGLGRPVVDRVSAGPAADVPPGPHVVRIAPGPAPGTVAVTFDSDLDPASVGGAFGLSGAGGGRLAASAAYDPATRTVTLSSPGDLPSQVALTVATSLRDVSGQRLAAPVQAPFSP